MRLVDMHRVHPHQDNSHVCSHCGERVGVYPTGQNVLRHNRQIKILCHVCVGKNVEKVAKEVVEIRAAGSWDEIAQEGRDSKDVSKA
jgi:hypothetical protein